MSVVMGALAMASGRVGMRGYQLVTDVLVYGVDANDAMRKLGEDLVRASMRPMDVIEIELPSMMRGDFTIREIS